MIVAPHVKIHADHDTEIRNLVYDQAHGEVRSWIALTQVCQQIRSEFLPSFLDQNISHIRYWDLRRYVNVFHPEPADIVLEKVRLAGSVDHVLKSRTLKIEAPEHWTIEHLACIDILAWMKFTTRPSFPVLEVLESADSSRKEHQYLAIFCRFMADSNLLALFKKVHMRFIGNCILTGRKGKHTLDLVLSRHVNGDWLTPGRYDMHELLEELLALKKERKEHGAEATHPRLNKLMLDVEEETEDTRDMQWEVRIAYEE